MLALTSAAIAVLIACSAWYIARGSTSVVQPIAPGPLWLKFTELHARLIEVLITVRSGASFVNNLHDKYGPVVQISRKTVLVRGKDAIREVYSVSNRLNRPDPLIMFYNYDTDNLVSLEDGQEHHDRRKPLRGVYSSEAITSAETQQALKHSVDRLIYQLKSRHGPLDLMRDLRHFLYQAMSHIIYGKQHALNTLDNVELQQRLEGDTAYQQAHLLSPSAAVCAYFPHLVLFLRRNNLAPSCLRFEDPLHLVSHELNQRALSEIDFHHPHKNAPFAEVPKHEPLFATLWNQKLPSKIIFSEAIDHFLASTSTTLDALVPLFTRLADPINISCQKKLRVELQSLGQNPSHLTTRELKALPFLTAVINETLRLHPSIPVVLTRQVTKPHGLNICGYNIPSGTTIGASPYVLGRDPEVFDQPDEWLPERWLGDDMIPEKMSEMKRRADFAFGTGARMCLGREVAWALMLAVVASIIGEFEVSVVDQSAGDGQAKAQEGSLVVRLRPLRPPEQFVGPHS